MRGLAHRSRVGVQGRPNTPVAGPIDAPWRARKAKSRVKPLRRRGLKGPPPAALIGPETGPTLAIGQTDRRRRLPAARRATRIGSRRSPRTGQFLGGLADFPRVFSCLCEALVYEEYKGYVHLALAWRPAVPYQTKSKSCAADEAKRAEVSPKLKTSPDPADLRMEVAHLLCCPDPNSRPGPCCPAMGINRPARTSTLLRCGRPRRCDGTWPGQ